MGFASGLLTIIMKKLTDLANQITVTITGDDKGVAFDSQVSVLGEFVAGKDSYPVPLVFQCHTDNVVGNTITSAVDITSIWQSDSLSATGMFGGTTAGNFSLIISPEIFEGVKIKYDSNGDVDPDNIEAEYYKDLTDEWTSVSFMATNSNPDYKAYGYNISQNLNEQVFYGFNPFTRHLPSPWTQQTFNINGVDYTGYVARMRLTDTIVEDPIVQQVKLHTDRIEIESQGIFKFGRARSLYTLNSGILSVVQNTLKSPVSQNVSYTSEIVAGYLHNELAKGKDDGFLFVVNRESELDTSIPLIISVSYYVEGVATGDIEFEVATLQILDNFPYTGTETPYSSYNQIESVATNDGNNNRRTSKFLVPVNKLASDSAIVVSFSRLGQTGVNDTLTNNIVCTHFTVEGYRWKA